MRINGLKQKNYHEIDNRITILERSMENTNHGQCDRTMTTAAKIPPTKPIVKICLSETLKKNFMRRTEPR